MCMICNYSKDIFPRVWIKEMRNRLIGPGSQCFYQPQSREAIHLVVSTRPFICMLCSLSCFEPFDLLVEDLIIHQSWPSHILIYSISMSYSTPPRGITNNSSTSQISRVSHLWSTTSFTDESPFIPLTTYNILRLPLAKIFSLTHISTLLEYPCLSRTQCGFDNDLFSDQNVPHEYFCKTTISSFALHEFITGFIWSS